MSVKSESKPPPLPGPLISEKYIDIPSQRLYSLSFGLLCQAIKIFDFFRYLVSSEDSSSQYGRKWMFVDFMYCALLAQLRIPRLNYSKSIVLLQIISLWLLDGLMFGTISVNMGRGKTAESLWSRFPGHSQLPSTPEAFTLPSLLSAISSLASFTGSSSKESHLLGQHTVRMSPISTAQLNPHSHTFCLSPPQNSVLIPVLLNNTDVVGLRYSITPLGVAAGEGKTEIIELGTKEIRSIEHDRMESLQLTRPSVTPKSIDAEEDDEWEWDDGDDDPDHTAASDTLSGTALQKTQSLTHIKLTKSGTVRLERVMDASGVAARISHSNQITVVPCPRAGFSSLSTVQAQTGDIRCHGTDTSSVDLEIEIGGVPPLSLRWYKELNGRRESFLVEAIETENNDELLQSSRHGGTYQELKVPLAILPDALGKHVYGLEEVMDGLGNTVQIESNHHLLSKTRPVSSHSVTVLRRPRVSFSQCASERPVSLLVGSEASIGISVSQADAQDEPWEVQVGYEPAVEDTGKGKGKKSKAWTKSLQTKENAHDVILKANAPGQYTILGVKGKYCEGDVMVPETCIVVEKPLPSAEIEWKKIHECSGDTGVSASLVLHGTPPFQVYYHVQRDKEPPREESKTFGFVRGELTLQPERSGHYVYTFTHLSDAYYRKVELKGPSTDQVVHPLAAAEFAARSDGRKKVVNSCSGSVIDVDVDLRGTGPWNLEVQIVGPKSTDTIQLSGLTSARETLHIPIPEIVDRNGGSFDIELVSIEDTYGCKRPVSIPGVSVNVRRVKSTVKFYGKEDKRHVTILEGERAILPLRLTGESPWNVRYRRQEEPDHVLRARLTTPNGELQVADQGIYELIDVSDNQCPGSVVADANTYTVAWIPRPAAKLSVSLQSKARYEPFNGSHILPPICEGLDDHVDLELSGRPPFQIMYNIAQDNDVGGTKVFDQPTFSSIQHHARFQLHTSFPGRKYYEVKQIGDAAYPLSKHERAIIRRSERLLFEQEVLARPSARFKTKNRMTYCLYDTFVPRDTYSLDGVVQLEGTPPFMLVLSIKNLAASETRTEIVEVHDWSWRMELPRYSFMSMGPHLVTIESVQDATGCDEVILDHSDRSIWVDVAESATIIPFNRREHYCVGDVSQFQLEGTPPWSIGYRINGKSYTQEAKISPFSLLQQQAGEFVITSIAHQHKMCRTAVTDLRFTVHELPSAQVGHGKRIFEDIHEGDQAEIVFTLIGEPPFTFTYQRAEPSMKKGGKPGKVLETHTVSGVTTKEYSIYSALEGTWTVTSISDRYCRYPPAHTDGGSEKSRK